MSTGLVLAIDQGTTNTKAVLVDAAGRVVASGSARVPIAFPSEGWVESDAMAVLGTVVDAVRICLANAAARRDELVAVAVSNQRESVVMWDVSTGTPLGPLVSWQCTRGAVCCEGILERSASITTDDIRNISGLPLDPMFSASKIAWLLQSIDRGVERAAAGEVKVGTVDSFLLWHLTGGAVHATDHTNASRTMLMHLDTGTWSDALCDLFDIPVAALPSIKPSSSRFATLASGGLLPELAGVPVAAMAGDSHAAMVGHGVVRPGRVKATFGTGSSVMAPVAHRVASTHLVATVGWSWERNDGVVETTYALEGNVYAAGAALEWVADLLGLGSDVEALSSIAGPFDAHSSVAFVPAFSGLGAPHWVPSVRGALLGLTRGSGRPEIARAAVDALAHQAADVVEAVCDAVGAPVHAIHGDGGALRSAVVAQSVADLTAAQVVRLDDADAAALGVALLAGLQIGMLDDPDSIAAIERHVTPFAPSIAITERVAARATWARAVTAVIEGVGNGEA